MDKLNFYVPAEFNCIKSNTADEKHIIKGYASTQVRDRQDEEIVQKGLDISEFTEYGWLNYDHDNKQIIGYPIKSGTRITPDGFFVEGELLKGVPLADRIWELAINLQKSKAPRKLGFSVEGNVLERDKNNRILKAKIYNVAVTPTPVNPTATWEAVVKSFSTYSLEKTITAGYDNGSVLKKEDLERIFSKLSEVLFGESEQNKLDKEYLKNKIFGKSVTKNETILYLQMYKGLSYNNAIKIINNI